MTTPHDDYGVHLNYFSSCPTICIWAGHGLEEFGCADLTPTQARALAADLVKLAEASEKERETEALSRLVDGEVASRVEEVKP